MHLPELLEVALRQRARILKVYILHCSRLKHPISLHIHRAISI